MMDSNKCIIKLKYLVAEHGQFFDKLHNVPHYYTDVIFRQADIHNLK